MPSHRTDEKDRDTPLVRQFNSAAVHAPKGSQPFELSRSFPPTTPIDLEIGCGVGYHPIRYAQQNPDRYLIAVEHTREKFSKFESRLRGNDKLSNLLPIHADAIAWVTHCLALKSVDRCFILYPNPNPKSVSKRWFRMPFMHHLLKVMKDTGEIILATNEKGYLEEALEYSKAAWNLEILELSEINLKSNPEHQPRTHFEKKYLERGETCYNVRFSLKSSASL